MRQGLNALCIIIAHFVGCHGEPDRHVPIIGAGSSLTSSLIRDAIFAYQVVHPEAQVSYVSMGPDRSTCRLKNYTEECAADDRLKPRHIDFIASDSLLTAEDYAQYPDLRMYPTVAGAVVPVYNFNNVTNLTLCPRTLAQIFQGDIRFWDDDRIRALNPDFDTWHIPKQQPIVLAVRLCPTPLVPCAPAQHSLCPILQPQPQWATLVDLEPLGNVARKRTFVVQSTRLLHSHGFHCHQGRAARQAQP